MAKKISEFKNPLTASTGSIFDIENWLGGVLWVVMFGAIFAMGAAVLAKVDKIIPGNQTPNMKPYAQEVVKDNGITVL